MTQGGPRRAQELKMVTTALSPLRQPSYTLSLWERNRRWKTQDEWNENKISARKQ